MSKPVKKKIELSSKGGVDEITIKIPQGLYDNHIEAIASKILGGCVGLMIPYDEKRFELIRHRIESVLYSYIKENSPKTLLEGEPKNE